MISICIAKDKKANYYNIIHHAILSYKALTTNMANSQFYVYYAYGPYRKYMAICKSEEEVNQEHFNITHRNDSYELLTNGVSFGLKGPKYSFNYTAICKKYEHNRQEVMYLVDKWEIDECDQRCYYSYFNYAQERLPTLTDTRQMIEKEFIPTPEELKQKDENEEDSRTIEEGTNLLEVTGIDYDSDVFVIVDHLCENGGFCRWQDKLDSGTCYFMEVYVLKWSPEIGIIPSHTDQWNWSGDEDDDEDSPFYNG